MTISRIKVWNAGEVLTASDLNGEFNNILDNFSIALGGDITDGSLTVPGLKFFNDTNTGLYRQGADQFALVAGGATAFVVTRAASPSTAFALFSRGVSDSARFYPALTFGGADDGIAAIAAGTLDFIAGGRRAAQASAYANATNYLVFTPGQTGAPAVLETGGGDTNVPLLLRAKGTGYVQASRFVFEAFGATQSSVQAGRAYWNTVESSLHIDAGTLIARVPAITSIQTGDLIVATNSALVSGATTFGRLRADPVGSLLTVNSGPRAEWLPPGTATQYLSILNGVPTYRDVSVYVGFGDGTAAITAGQTTFYGSWAGTAGGGDALAFDHIMPFAGTARNLFFRSTAAPGGGQSFTCTLQLENVDTAVTAAISGAAATTANDTAHSFAFPAGAKISVKIVSSAGAATVSIRGAFEIIRTFTP